MQDSNTKKQIRTVAVFCSSRMGSDPEFAAHARELGQRLGEAGINVVYGGGASGLMGIVSQSARDNGSSVLGIITHTFRNSAFYRSVDGVIERAVAKLHIRKAQMIAKADAVIMLPGGLGSLDELFEAAALMDMEIAARSTNYVKPIIMLNTNGFYDLLISHIQKATERELIYPGREGMIRAVPTPEAVINKINKWNSEGILRACDLADLADEGQKVRQEPAAAVNGPR